MDTGRVKRVSLTTRSTNPHGQRPEEFDRAPALQATVEPLPRRGATHEVDTSLPLDRVVARVLEIAGFSGYPGLGHQACGKDNGPPECTPAARSLNR